MSYTSLIFVCFLFITYLLYFTLPQKSRWAVLLTASYLFYFLHSTWLGACLLATTFSIYIAGLGMGKAQKAFLEKKGALDKDARKQLKARTQKIKRYWVLGAVLLNFGILFFFKFYNLAGEGLNSLLTLFGSSAQVPHLNLVMPLGISYYTLQSISYVVDVYRGRVKADRNFGRLALFVSFFPQIIQGPIGR